MSNIDNKVITDEFVKQYQNRKINWGFNGLGYIVYKRTYSRQKDNGTTEEWHETLQRCINGAQKIGAEYSKEEAEKLFDYMFNFKCTYSGRMLWQLGTSVVDKFGGNSLLNCFEFSTEILTREGIKRIGELVNSKQFLMTDYGKWVESEIKEFGEQELFKLILNRNGSKKEILVTKNHRWFRYPCRNGLERNLYSRVECLTSDLKPKDRLISTFGQSIKSIERISEYGIQHGLVYGDGSVCNNVGQITLCGDKNKYLLKYFPNPIIYNSDKENIIIGGLPKYFKLKPDITLDKSYLYGWLAGYFAADGCVDETGEIRLFSSNKSNLLFVRDVCVRLGISYTPIIFQERIGIGQKELSKLYSMAFHGVTLTENFFLMPHHLERFQNHSYKEVGDWTVEKIESTGLMEKVYCAVVPNTYSFVLEGNILTGNCWFVSIQKIEDFCFIFENLMLGGGVGYSVRREDIYQLPKVKRDIKIILKNTKDADFICPDSREGWISLLYKVLESFFYTGKSFTYSTILVRCAGESIKGFGGIASGPKILEDGVKNICEVLKSREGKRVRSIDVLDICNLIGSIVVSGNIRRCLPEESLVYTDKGLIEIKSIKINDNVLISDGLYKKVSNIFKQGIQQTIIIKTQDGELECTPNHKVAILNSVHKYEWKLAKDILIGDRLISSRCAICGSETKLPFWSYIKPKNSTTCQDIKIPELDEKMAWFIGLFCGDGYTYANREKNGFNAYVSIVLQENELKIAERAKVQLERFGLKNVILSHRKNENSWIVCCQSKQIAWYLDKYIKKPKTEIRIPSFIKQAKQNIRLAYLSGVADSDGAMMERPLQVVSTVYKRFAVDVQQLLYSCGIESRFREGSETRGLRKNWQKQYFVNLITLYSKRKFANIPTLCKDISIGNKSQYANGYPNEWVERGVKKILGYNDQINIDAYQRISGDQLKFIPVKVIGIEQGRMVDTYDIEVKDSQEFYCNGYLVHNSAQISLGDPDDILFLKAKRWDLGNIPNWRAMSNNTIYADNYDHIMETVWDGYGGNGEPYGFFNLELSQNYGRLGEREKDNCIGLNPCQNYSAPILTKYGIRMMGEIKVGDEIWSKNGWTTVINKRSSGINSVYAFKTRAGSFYGTKNHKIISNDDKIEVDYANTIDVLVGPEIDRLVIAPQDVMDGLMIGDGSRHVSSAEKVYLIIGGKDKDYFNSEISSLILGPHSVKKGLAWKVKTSVCEVELPNLPERIIPKRFIYGDPRKVAGFLRGLYSANGSICGNRITLKSTSKRLIEQAQLMLNSLGIISYYTVNKPSDIEWHNGNYQSRKSYDLNISTERKRFANLIGFLQDYKNEILNQIIEIKGKPKSSYEILKKIYLGDEEVFDITVANESHTYWTGGLNVSNCGEVTLASYENCNLSELMLNNIISSEELIDCSKLLYKTQKAIAALSFLHDETNKVVHKNMRLGLSVTGICQSLHKINWLDGCYKELKKFDIEWSKKHNYPESIKLTTVKPSGTVSLLGNCTPGVHPGYDKYYIRRIRMASNDKLIEVCKEMGCYVESLINFDGSIDRNTMIVSFPCCLDDNVIIVKEMTAVRQLELVKELQTCWSDNAVSATVYYKKEELSEIKAWLKQNYKNSIKSISFLLHQDHGFNQAPYESISKEKYEEAIKGMKSINIVNISDNDGYSLEGIECNNGACPVK